MFILLEDILIPFKRDPAAKNIFEVLFTYAGLHAILAYRVAHLLYKMHIPFIPRLTMSITRFLTGVEIHHGATIGRRFFIDHGMGVVIGETAEIGDDVVLFQGVTLGGTSTHKGKRHPTLGNQVVVGANAVILGNVKIGDNVRIGAGSVVVTNIPTNSTVIGVPGRIVKSSADAVDALKLEHTILPDPIMDRLNKLYNELKHTEKEIKKYHAEQKAKHK